jgi:hypothetical protein
MITAATGYRSGDRDCRQDMAVASVSVSPDAVVEFAGTALRKLIDG